MRVSVNGKKQDLDAGETVSQLLERLGHSGPYVLVELNGEPLERERYLEVALREGDILVVAGPVAGG